MLFGNAKKESNCSVKIIQKKVGGLDNSCFCIYTVPGVPVISTAH